MGALFMTAILLTGAPVVFLDDVADVNSKDLHKIITGRGRAGGELGKSNILDAPTVSTFVATGNNPVYGRDMAGRTCRVRLDANVERPEDRGGFAIAPKAWLPANRDSILASLYDDAADTSVDGAFIDEWITRLGSDPVRVSPLASLVHVPELQDGKRSHGDQPCASSPCRSPY